MPNLARVSRRWRVDENTYEVGYGKPPKHSQFQKGRSGNPKGRPKKPKNLPALVLKAFGEKVAVKGPNGRQLMTKLEAALVQLINKALSGDIKAFREVIRLREQVQEQEPFLVPPPVFQVNFIHPKTGKPVTNDDPEYDDNGIPYAKSLPDEILSKPPKSDSEEEPDSEEFKLPKELDFGWSK
jgi:hypothetical protein